MGYKVGSGIDEYISNLGNLIVDCDEIGKRGVYDGIGLVADRIRSNINSIPTGNGHDGKITKEERMGLSAGLGISKIRVENGSINAKTGFAGYTGKHNKAVNTRVLNVAIARKVESGTSGIQKYSFIAKAGTATRAAAEAAIAKTIEEEINKRMK